VAIEIVGILDFVRVYTSSAVGWFRSSNKILKTISRWGVVR
jgi:hypothetical protein